MNRINEQIKAPELRVIDETGANVGVLSLEKAKELAKEKGLDLIEIAGNTNPPVAKIISFDKFRYQEGKKMKKLRAHQKTGGMKQIQISVKEASHDLEIKAERVNEFLDEGNQVEIFLVMKGREKANRDWGKQKLLEFMKKINPEHKVIMEPRYGGRGFIAQIANK